MTTTANLGPFDAILSDDSPQPDPLEDLMWARGLKVLYWTVGDPQRVDEDDPETTLVGTLQVVWTNGRRMFTSIPVLDYDVIHALVGQDEVPEQMTALAVDEILAGAVEFDPADLVHLAADPNWAEGNSDRQLRDGDMLRGAAHLIGGEWGLLLEALSALVDSLSPGLSYADPKARVASIAVQIAWDLL